MENKQEFFVVMRKVDIGEVPDTIHGMIGFIPIFDDLENAKLSSENGKYSIMGASIGNQPEGDKEDAEQDDTEE